MRFVKPSLVFWTVVVIPLLQIPSYSTGVLDSVPARCTFQFFKSFQKENNESAKQLLLLSDRVRRESDLALNDVRSLLGPNPALAVAERLHALRVVVSSDEWKAGVDQWAFFLRQTAESQRAQPNYRACGTVDTLVSARDDMAIGVLHLLIGGAALYSDSSDALALVPVNTLIGASGILGLGTDVIMYIPGLVKNKIQDMRYRREARQASNALKHFSEMVDAYETKYPPPAHV